jgi:dipeptidyl aminopeptidase/acylaminoacyl peptidase
MASWGYVVAATQYRGVDGGDGVEEFGGADVDDLLALLPVLQAEAGADASRVAIYGGSRGGLMTYLALTRCDRFRAAAVRSGVSDALSWVEQRPEMAEIFAEIVPGYAEEPDAALLARSPARWAERLAAETPLLLLHGTADWRVPPDAALRMASALQAARRPYRLVLLEGSDHSLQEHRDEHDRQVREWFDRFVRDGEELPNLTPHGD